MRRMKSAWMAASLLAAMTAFSSTAFSAGDAGCGLGSLVIQKNTKVSQTLAMTTNGTFSSQFFGITSGTSNCSAHGIAMNQKEAQMYAEANYPNLQVDLARGQGENLVAFAQLMGCEQDSVSVFGEMTRNHYQDIFPERGANPSQMVQSVRSTIHSDPALAQKCRGV